jgi:hypothetical protein
MALTLNHPHWLYALGDATRVEVLRSPLLRDEDDWWQQVQRFTAKHGLVLAARSTFQEPHFMFGAADAEVYLTPAKRQIAYENGTQLLPDTIAGFAGTTREVFAATALGHVAEHWPLPPEAVDFDDDGLATPHEVN